MLLRRAVGFGFLVQSLIAFWFVVHWNPAISRLWPDDAFYYQQIARHIAQGDGSVFSPHEPTNGYHPLWMVLLVGLHALRLPLPALIASVLGMSIVCNALAAWLLSRCLWADVRLQALGALLYLLSPWMVCLTLTGLETPLSLLFLVLWLRQAQRLWEREIWERKKASVRSAWLLYGALCGLLLLARTDTIFFVVLGSAALVFRHRDPVE